MGRLIYEDVKGVITRDFTLKLRLWKVHGPGPLRLTKRKGKMFVTVREIIPDRDRSKVTGSPERRRSRRRERWWASRVPVTEVIKTLGSVRRVAVASDVTTQAVYLARSRGKLLQTR